VKLKRLLAVLIAAGCSSAASAAETRHIDWSHNDSEIVQASCNCESGPSVGCDLANPMQFGGCDGCNDNSCDGCGGCDGLGGCDTGLFGLGIIKKSEHCYDDFISPMTNPVYFEDPRQLSELRFIFINHKLPFLLGAPAGSVQLFAMQFRVRLTERLSLIAVKDGFINSQSPLLGDGWADVSAGLKYSLLRNPSNGRMLSAGFRFETTTGSNDALQGNGDGVFDLFLSGGSLVGRRGHFLTSSGIVLPVDSSAENQMFYWSNHLDRRIFNRSYIFTELNWFNYMNNAGAFPLPLEGGDLFNLGAPGIKGNNIVTNAYGLKFKPNRNIESGVAFEFPLTETRGVMDNRFTADLIFRY
jgi:hypothetical protein